jgi:hypothetical protein
MAHCASDQNCGTTPQSQITPFISNKTRIRTLIMALTRNGLYVPDELLKLIYKYLGLCSGEAVMVGLKLPLDINSYDTICKYVLCFIIRGKKDDPNNSVVISDYDCVSVFLNGLGIIML